MVHENHWDDMRNRIIGLGDQSSRKSYYPELQRKIIELEKAQQRLAQSEANLRAVFDSVAEAIFIHDTKTGAILNVNQSVCRMYGYTAEEVCQLGVSALSLNEPPYTQAEAMARIQKAAAGEPQQFEWHARDKSDRLFWVEVAMSLAIIDGKKRLIATVRDITERKQAEAVQKRLEAELLQAQKMESVGRLAGGVAHDFNNMLSVILGHTEIALDELDPDHPLRADLQGIRDAAERSTDLTRQLLAFARRQTAVPKIIKINDTVEGMLKMLRRLIGENINLVWLPGRDVGPIRMDPSQIDQILANLCVNARDAISGVGKIIIETQKAAIDSAYCWEHPEFTPGEFIMLAVSDTGCGMEKNMLVHVFEPFFTTKDVGKGTGLGLATVYGIVKQNAGFINVYSEPGLGTTFKIYLPQIAAEIMDSQTFPNKNLYRGRGEVVLLVEDETALLKPGKTMLEKLGYQVLTASSPKYALQLAEKHAGEIKLLMTDVVMPEMNGRDLAALVEEIVPGVKCLFTSGYTADVIAHHGILEKDLLFIQKPFSLKDLSLNVHEALK
ncbi:MAG TPA: PAS domain S-box protein [Candidatus Hydrogenedentes bacterium]|nr:PAS domain S-box protein [Candidatus Hydrogenedentota bacterium]